MVNKVRTIDFLPEIFRTIPNRQFLRTSLDVITDQPNLRRVEGFIGEKYGYGVEPTDKYVVEPTKSRADYQLDPAVVFLKDDTQIPQDFINYPGILNTLNLEGADVSNNNRLFENEFYSWDPFVDYDKIVNYAQYYWIPNGPDAVSIASNIVYLTGEYDVTNDTNGYNFLNIAQTNPDITLLRGGTYTFVVPAGSDNFWIQTVPGVDATIAQRTITGTTNNGTNNGTITFVVPDNLTLINTKLYYQNGSDINSVGIINLIESNATNVIFVEDIIGKKNYTSPNNIEFVNGLKIKFESNVSPAEYANKTYYVEGVGSSIVLLPYENFIASEISGEAIYNPWDIIPWDIDSWDAQLYVPVSPEYITISRNSRDYNAWTRSNRWFHQSVLDTTFSALGYITKINGNAVTRAQRPIIEYRGNLKLFNSGIVSLGLVNLVDTTTTDAFSTIEGNTIAGVGPINGIYLEDGMRIVFASDTNPLVRQNIYFVTLVPTLVPNQPIISLAPDNSVVVRNGAQVFVPYISQITNSGSTWWFNASDISWNEGQKKTTLNQYPYYDIFDQDNNSLSDNNVYVGTTFSGTTLFSYTPGTGTNDPVLGFPIAYSNPSTIGDILFTVNLNTDTFTYNQDSKIKQDNINIGFVHNYIEENIIENLSGWVTAAGPSFQYQVFEYPIIKNLTYSANNTVITVTGPGSGYTVGDKLKILGSSIGGTTPENDLTFTVETVIGSGLSTVLATSISGTSVDINDTFYNVDIVTLTGNGSSATVSVVVAGPGTTTFTADVLAKTTPNETLWNPVVVYYNDNILDKNEFSITRDTVNNTTSVTVGSTIGSKITLLIISDDVSKTAYYQTPSNLENNPFNTNITGVSVGDLKNQYRTIFSNAPGVQGKLFGNNNINNLGNVNMYGTSIIQNSASLALAGVFLRKPEANIFKALEFNKQQYQNYKTLIVDLATATDYSVYTPANEILDDIIYKIASTKNSTSAFFWSDMIFSGNPYLSNTYTFGANTNTATYPLSVNVWTDDMFSTANYRGVAVYLTRVISGKNVTKQLLNNIDYVVSTTPNTPNITINYNILLGDKITIKEYNQTYGSYCPNTPSKLGLYPIFIPNIVEVSNSVYYLLGHDGSLTRLFGNFNPITGELDDFRDQVLYEFENRVFNNFKVAGEIPLVADDVIPGEFRTTDYSYNEILNIYTPTFLNWVGLNRIDYKTQYYSQLDKFTYNYNQSSNRITNEKIIQGNWRGIFNWLYDTANPGNAPWEMLGLANKPSWWDTHYGPAPYSSGNIYMWQDIANGYVWNNGDPYINPKRIRSYLLDILPVDSYGITLNPFEIIVGNYDRLTFNRDWVVGDQGPAEYSYIQSSAYPYDLMRILALTKPAKFFNLFVDRDKYKFNDVLVQPGQYLYNDRYHLDARVVEVYGNGVAKHSYINWVVDSINQLGANGTDVITALLKNIDVRLTYSMAGFTAKNYLKFLIEKASPTSVSNNLLVPDENYTILLYDNPPQDTVVYTSVIIQKVSNGYTIYGNSSSKNYFTVSVPKNNAFKRITVNGLSVQVCSDFYENETIIVPYGTILYSAQSLSQFLKSYGNYLTIQGVQFANIIDGIVYNWDRMVEEFLAWSQQNWEVGSIISINPNARNFTLSKPGFIPQPLTIQGQNFVLNQNLLPIQNQDMAINRDNESMELKIISPGDTVAYANINLNNIEHVVIFDNQTSFNDTIYNLSTGLRQNRLLLRGYKTAEWSGYLDTSGFILNENNVQNWIPNKKYPKNIIVIYKNKYYTARKLIEPNTEFIYEDWLETEYGEIKTGLLPNPSTAAYEAQFYYDITRSNLEIDADLLAFSLIGFRPRDYLAAADLSDTTQINVYRNLIRTKGTTLLAESFRGAQLEEGEIDYTIQENWAIKYGDFGAILNSNFVEARLDQNLLTGNPTLIGFSQTTTEIPNVQQTVPIADLINYERPPVTNYFLPHLSGSYTLQNGLPSAGYVNLNDSALQQYTYEYLNDDPTNILNLLRGEYVWIANYKNSWNIFEAQSLNNQIISAENNLNGTVNIVFNNQHGLDVKDLIAIINFDYRVNGFYTVVAVVSIYEITINLNLDFNVNVISGLSAGFKLTSKRYEQASDAAASVVPFSQWTPRKVWVDYDENSQWAVYGAGIAYKEQATQIITGQTGSLDIAYTQTVGQLIADGIGYIYRYVNDVLVQTISGAGVGDTVEIKAMGEYVYCSSPTENLVYVYKFDAVLNELTLYQVINPAAYITSVTGAIAVSSDNQWLYIADATNQIIAIYNYSELSTYFVYTNSITSAAPAGSGWGTSIATSTDGIKLLVGAPYEDIGIIDEAGAAYIYTRRVQRFYANGVATTFTLANSAPNNIADIYVNDIQDTAATVVGTTVTFGVPPADGAIVTVSTGYIDFVQRFESDEPHLRGWYGLNVDTNRYGADLIIGVPYELSTVDNKNFVEGAVYRYTNSGQRYGVITTTITGSLTGTIFIDGWQVDYSGNITAIRDAINNSTPTNIIAATDGNTLTITVKENTPEVLYDIIDLTGSATNITNLGITLYTQTQVIKNFDLLQKSAFGFNVKMNERDSLLISAPTKNRTSPTTFDFKTYCKRNDTIFDNDTTIFVDTFSEQGEVYLYDYLPAFNENIVNPGQYAFGQYISTTGITNNTPSPKFGYSLFFGSNLIFVGAPDWSTTTKGVATFATGWTPVYECEVARPSTWYIDKLPLPIVDIEAVSDISIYNTENNQTLEFLDYIDPVQGKLLGAVATNLNYLSSTDPAVYNANGIYWTWDHLGENWLDLNTIRMLNYHQPDVTYNAKNWGKAFPGSTADIYTWIESTVAPLNYPGPGIPINFNDYNSTISVDNSTNSLITKYYFWVKNYDFVPKNKTLSSLVLSAYLLNPLNSGIGYLAPITTNIVGLYNSGGYIQSNSSALHIGYGIPKNVDNKHSSWLLIRTDNPDDFLTGLPTILGDQPTSLYLKYIESFSGFDGSGNFVPNPNLPALVRYGTSFRPIQSMFIDRLAALKNYVTYANDIMIKLPIVEIRDLSMILAPPTNNYWYYTNWWAEGYSNDTKAVIEVNNINDLQTIFENQLLVNIEGINTFLTEGLIAKVKENRYGKSEYYIYSNTGNLPWTRIGAENSTIQISSDLYNEEGWDEVPWDNIWNKTPITEIVDIIRWLNEVCYTNELSIEKNRSLILMFKYIQSESLEQNNYLPWLNKTSLIDVKHLIRRLLPYKKYQRDNQEFLEGFLNEIKPYHVLIKEFVYGYNGLDEYFGAISDFDLPAQYSTTQYTFESPQLVYVDTGVPNQYLPNNAIWQQVNYTQWFQNKGLSLNSSEVANFPLTYLTSTMSVVSTTVPVKSIYGFPTSGYVTIDDEIINYSGIDYFNSELTGLLRGVNGTPITSHTDGTVVYVDFPPVIMYDTGRGYTEPPRITAYIDTTVYPAPAVQAVIEPIMAADRVIGINIINPGEGYMCAPQIIIDGSSISGTFSSTDVDVTNNTITIGSHPFQTGDGVVFYNSPTESNPIGLTTGSYYWIRSIDSNTVALYSSYENATCPLTSPYLHISTDDGRIDLQDQGTGSSMELTVTARAICLTNSLPVREIKIKMNFDRISYTYSEGIGSAAGRIYTNYDPTLSMPGKELNLLMEGVETPDAVILGEDFVDTFVDVNLESPSFTDTAPTAYDFNGNVFLSGYTPEELVGGYVTDTVVITIDTDDTLVWTHTIEIDKYGNMKVYNNSGNELMVAYNERWWYGDLYTDPVTNPAANTTLSTNTSSAAVFLRS